jgi:COP9 signalosome complex subunit 4
MKRQFLPAATKYLEISLVKELHETEQMEALRASLICAILAGAGSQRTLMLNTLYKDERSKHPDFSDDSGLLSVLEKMVFGRILKKQEVEAFSKLLKTHQLATLADGSTVFDRYSSFSSQELRY